MLCFSTRDVVIGYRTTNISFTSLGTRGSLLHILLSAIHIYSNQEFIQPHTFSVFFFFRLFVRFFLFLSRFFAFHSVAYRCVFVSNVISNVCICRFTHSIYLTREEIMKLEKMSQYFVKSWFRQHLFPFIFTALCQPNGFVAIFDLEMKIQLELSWKWWSAICAQGKQNRYFRFNIDAFSIWIARFIWLMIWLNFFYSRSLFLLRSFSFSLFFFNFLSFFMAYFWHYQSKEWIIFFSVCGAHATKIS